MNAPSSSLQQLRHALATPTRNVVGLVDEVLALCQEHGLQLDWQEGGCRIRSSGGEPEGTIDVPLRKSVFRAILARVAVLCNERSPNSVSPYGGQGEVSVGADPAMTFRVEFANTPDEQRLELTRVRPKAVLSFPLRFARRSAPQLELTRVRPKAVLPVPSSSSLDRKLINRCMGREPGAWNDFVDRYVGLIYHVIQHVAQGRSRVVSQADMEDIAAEILLRIVDDDYEILRRYKGVSSLPTYLTVIARRTCVKEMVKRQREAELSHASAHRENVSDASGEVEAIATAEEVDRMLEELPEREAEAVRLYHLQFMNYREIGKRLGIPEASVGPILSKARKRLRNTTEHRTAM